MQNANDQIEESDIGLTDHYGHYQWFAEKNGSVIASKYAEIAPSTGNMGSSNMGDMLNTPSIVTSDHAISYGFYDAGPGWGSLTNQDQSYVYVTSNHSTWMGDLAGSTAASSKPFARFALPGVHDAGMFDPSFIHELVRNSDYLAALLELGALTPFAGTLAGITVAELQALSAGEIEKLIIGFSFTQKDNIATMLDLGIRYFDFRPGYCVPFYEGGIYHQHALIPGYPYNSFLRDVLGWLEAHPSEIVVLNINDQGFVADDMTPSTEVLEEYFSSAVASSGASNIAIGDKDSLSQTYGQLIAQNKRLIFLNQIGSDYYHASKYDSYNSGTYTTTDPADVIGALNGMSRSHQGGHDYTVLQLQATPEGTDGGILSNLTTLSDASSPILSTKAMFDRQTYTWLRQHVASRFDPDQTIVFLNDFGDNALVDIAKDISRDRINA
ncbi:hypothetical protein [Microbulbifer taiwanensis]|uniref:PLC-like phosphodiesterase n=2 Tax=Microbulbifer taiwanensis TaxID=986746 RepID=A0ABW1YV12_9GAMM